MRLFKLYVSKRPFELQTAGKFYLNPRQDKFVFHSEWFVRQPMGKNTISSIMKNLIAGTEIENSQKRITNHSGRKTLIKKLKAAQIPESSIIKVIGHTTERGLCSYDPEDEGEFQRMSNAIQSVAKDVDFRKSDQTQPSSS